MEETSHDYGYEFTVSLCDAIAQWTEMKEKENPKVFVYRGANLRFALERVFFPRYSRDKELLKLFSKYRSEESISATFSDQIKKEILLLMCVGLPVENIKLKQNELKIFSKKVIAQVIRSLKKIFSKIRTRINYSRFQNKKIDTVFCTSLPRFVAYAKEIAEELPNVFYFSISREMCSFFNENNLPFLNFFTFGRKINKFADPVSYVESFGLAETYDLVFECLKTAKPKVVVTIEGASSLDEVVNQVCKQISVPCICIQHGWANMAETYARNMSFSKMLVWGDGFKELLQPYNPKQKFIVTGNHVVKSSHAESKLKEKVKTISFLMQTKSQVLTEQKMNDFINLALWAGKEFPNLEIVVREHPGAKEFNPEKTDKIPNIKFMNPGHYTLAEVFEKSDLSIIIYSSTILESIAMGVLPIIVNTTGQPRYWPYVDSLGAGIEVKSTEQAKKVISDFTAGTLHPSDFYQNMMQFRKKYFKAFGKEAAKNIAREILNP